MLPPDSKHYIVLLKERLPFIIAYFFSHFCLCKAALLLSIVCRTAKNPLRQLNAASKVLKQWVENFQLSTFRIK